jgi:hypothetical protein
VSACAHVVGGRADPRRGEAGQPVAVHADLPREGIGGRIDLYRTSNSGAEGKISFANVPPGDYKLFAWEEIKQGAWQDVAYMEKFEDKGRLVHIEKAGASNETIQVIKSDAE